MWRCHKLIFAFSIHIYFRSSYHNTFLGESSFWYSTNWNYYSLQSLFNYISNIFFMSLVKDKDVSFPFTIFDVQYMKLIKKGWEWIYFERSEQMVMKHIIVRRPALMHTTKRIRQQCANACMAGSYLWQLELVCDEQHTPLKFCICLQCCSMHSAKIILPQSTTFSWFKQFKQAMQ